MKSTSFFTLFSVILVLCLLGIYGIISLHAGNITDILKENLNIVIELESNFDQVSIIESKLQAYKEVKKESIRFIEKSNALDIMNKELGADYLLNSNDNPFSDLLLFNVHYNFVDTITLNRIANSIREIEGVEKVSYYNSVYDYIESNVKRMSRILLIVGILLGFFAFSLIYSTIQLGLYAERFKIRTMELVGASWNQVRKPFVVKSLKLAFWSTIISVLVLLGIMLIVSSQFVHFWAVINIFYVLVIFMLMGLFSLFITQLASYIVVNRYLGAEKSRFY